jgi:hypothetical protein
MKCLHQHVRDENLALSLASMFMLVFGTMIACGSNNQDASQQVDCRQITLSGSIMLTDTPDSSAMYSIRSIGMDPTGELYILDNVAGSVFVFSPSGECLRMISSDGLGPGEVRNPTGMAVLDDGRLLVCSPFQGGIHSFSWTGDYLGLAIEYASNPPMTMIGVDSASFVADRMNVRQDADGLTALYTIGRYSSQTEPVTIYYSNEFALDPSNLTEVLNETYLNVAFCADRQGNVFIAPRSTDVYHIEGYDRTGTELFVIDEPIPPVEKTPVEIQEEEEYMEAWLGSIGVSGVGIVYSANEYRWAIDEIGCSRDEIWVRRGTCVAPAFDVYSRTGDLQYIARVDSMPGEESGWTFCFLDSLILAYNQYDFDTDRILIFDCE